jgi:hypothetical protein
MVANRLANSILPSSPKIWQSNPPFAVTIQFKVGVLNEQNSEQYVNIYLMVFFSR